FEKVILLRIVDTKWMDHIDQMDQLRQGIHLRAYAQNDPLREYQLEGYNMFEAMINSIEEEVTHYIFKAQIRENLEREEVVKEKKILEEMIHVHVEVERNINIVMESKKIKMEWF